MSRDVFNIFLELPQSKQKKVERCNMQLFNRPINRGRALITALTINMRAEQACALGLESVGYNFFIIREMEQNGSCFLTRTPADIRCALKVQ